MGHIEFIGAPGAGKSTVHSALTGDNDWLYGADEAEAVRRRFGATAGRRFRLLYRLLPPTVRSAVEDSCLRHRYLRSAFLEFVERNPEFPETVADVLAPADRKYWVFSLCRYAAEQYQLGTSTVAPDEVLCLDENFHQYGAHFMFETTPDPDPADFADYFEMVPTPDVLVHVDAPSDVCVTRQRERGDDGSVLSSADAAPNEFPSVVDAQRKYREACSRVVEHLSRETAVVVAENTGAVEECVAEIEEELAGVGVGTGP